jgi:hypothetical protein
MVILSPNPHRAGKVEPERVTFALPEVAVTVPETVKVWVPTERETVVVAKPLAANINMRRKGRMFFILSFQNSSVIISVIPLFLPP